MFSTLQPVWLVRAFSCDMTMLLTLVAAWSIFVGRGGTSLLYEAHGLGGGGDIELVVSGLMCGVTKGRGAVKGIGCGVQS